LGRVENNLSLVPLTSYAASNVNNIERFYSNSTQTDGIVYYEPLQETSASSPLPNTAPIFAETASGY
ncbi:hypothetical protein NDU88_005193, partial [Pleurodeles waltl]